MKKWDNIFTFAFTTPLPLTYTESLGPHPIQVFENERREDEF